MAIKLFRKVIKHLDSELGDRVVKAAAGQTANAARELYRLAGNRRIRLAVTGLSRSGKSVFITSLVDQLLAASPARHRLPRLRAVMQGRFLGAQEAPQPDSTVPTFRYHDYHELLHGDPPQWPAGTEDISQIRLHLRCKTDGMLDSVLGEVRERYLDIIDYPGEWLVDLTMLEQDFNAWSAQMWAQAEQPHLRELSSSWRQLMQGMDTAASADRQQLSGACTAFRDYLTAAKRAGYNYLQPGRVLLPGALAGSPAVTFCPCPKPAATVDDASLYTQLAARYEMYRKDVIKPFYQQHFSKFDCQIVLVDLMYALQQGPAHFADTRETLNALLASFSHGRSNLIARLFSPRIERILFAATKADQVNHGQYDNLQKLLQSMLRPTLGRADFHNVRHTTLALASVKASETVVDSGDDGQEIEYVRGRLATEDFSAPAKELHYPPGTVPETLPDAASWGSNPFTFYAFHPPRLNSEAGSMPHINVDKALDFLIGDKL